MRPIPALTVFLFLLAASITGQCQKMSVTRSVNDDGKLLKLAITVENQGRSVNYHQEFDVRAMNQQQKDVLMKRIEDSLKTSPILSGTTQSGINEKQLVADAAMDYVEAFYFGDTMKLNRSVSPAVIKYGYYHKKDETTYAGEPMSHQEMTDYVLRVKQRNNPNSSALYKNVEVLDYQDKTAAAKCTAWWGTDYLLLAKLEGKWMITHILWQSPPVK
ncbi:MAG: hypothetical protein JWN76_2383 [Chitinophagaceae bacterium]|nr:hypothetical protein [Chitinophagaceae bacterium]